MNFLHPVSLAVGLTLSNTPYAEVFVLDPSQSFIEIDIPSLVLDGPWGYTSPNVLKLTDTGAIEEVPGEFVILGYSWHVETQTVRYSLAGRFEWLETGLRQDEGIGVALRNIELYADTPNPWKLELPSSLIFDTETGGLTQNSNGPTPCGPSCYVLWVTQYDPYTTSVFGQRAGNEIRFTGVQNRMTVAYTGTFSGGLELPAEIPLPADPTIRYNIVATAVPEPAQYGLLLAAMPLVWLSVRRKRQLRERVIAS